MGVMKHIIFAHNSLVGTQSYDHTDLQRKLEGVVQLCAREEEMWFADQLEDCYNLAIQKSRN